MNQLEYDNNGNLFIRNKYNDDIYMFAINSNDDIYLEKIINKIYDTNMIQAEIKKNPKENKLHMTAMKEAINELDNNNLDDFDQDQVQEIANTYNEFVSNPEYKYYNQETCEDDEDDEDCYDDNDENRFTFYNSNTICIKKSELIYDPSYFEFLILKGNTLNSQLLFRSNLTNNQPFYRISIFVNDDNANGIIDFNIIGTKIINYNINFDTLEINKNNVMPIDKFN